VSLARAFIGYAKIGPKQRGEEVKWVDFASWVETYVFDR
jgi:hypothetical protein